ncbi:MAG: cob(I)yrinic acid a,c-diamide adenosyltransferase, partial [Actinomycetota bacterium]|nr:cob(I)yrinic acid a,c-diamide adenosyltransferase [Actinomycetota bacterium]
MSGEATASGGARGADPAGRQIGRGSGDAGSAEPRRRKPRDRPLVIVLTGHGKGKSTSAFGMLMRSWARGYRCG